MHTPVNALPALPVGICMDSAGGAAQQAVKECSEGLNTRHQGVCSLGFSEVAASHPMMSGGMFAA